MSVVSIYALCDPDTMNVKYVGKTCMPIRRRLNGHISQSTLKPENKRNKWILSLTKRPKIILLESTTHKTSNEREKFWIEKYGLSNLVNGNKGGGGNNEIGVRRNNAYKSRFIFFLSTSDYSKNTIKNYTCYLSLFVEYITPLLKSPKEINAIELAQYLTTIKNRNTRTSHLIALKVFYKFIMNQPDKFKNIPYEYL